MFVSVGWRVLKGVRRCRNVFGGTSIIHLAHVEFEFRREMIIRCYSLLARTINEGDGQDQHSFAVSYLVKSCGLSLKDAQHACASGRLAFKTQEKPDSVLALLKTYGFTDTHISRIARSCPQVLVFDPKTTLVPKLDFYRSIGMSGIEIGHAVSTSTALLTRSLNNHIIPFYEHLKSLIGNDRNTARALSTWLRVIPSQRMLQILSKNVLVLRNLGVSRSSISMLLTYHPWVVCCSHDRFNKLVDDVKEIGFHPSKSSFSKGIVVMYGFGKEGLLNRVEVFGRFGWSKEEVMAAFISQPTCLALSEKRIISAMDFLVNRMGWPSELLAKHPGLLCFSMEKRIIPRCLVAQVLLSSNCLKDELSINSLLKASEKDFLKRFVVKYQKCLPQLMDVYQMKAPCRLSVLENDG